LTSLTFIGALMSPPTRTGGAPDGLVRPGVMVTDMDGCPRRAEISYRSSASSLLSAVAFSPRTLASSFLSASSLGRELRAPRRIAIAASWLPC